MISPVNYSAGGQITSRGTPVDQGSIHLDLLAGQQVAQPA
jgi:hypothetical protein